VDAAVEAAPAFEVEVDALEPVPVRDVDGVLVVPVPDVTVLHCTKVRGQPILLGVTNGSPQSVDLVPRPCRELLLPVIGDHGLELSDDAGVGVHAPAQRLDAEIPEHNPADGAQAGAG
jgi:hypothetical protein